MFIKKIAFIMLVGAIINDVVIRKVIFNLPFLDIKIENIFTNIEYTIIFKSKSSNPNFKF